MSSKIGTFGHWFS